MRIDLWKFENMNERSRVSSRPSSLSRACGFSVDDSPAVDLELVPRALHELAQSLRIYLFAKKDLISFKISHFFATFYSFYSPFFS